MPKKKATKKAFPKAKAAAKAPVKAGQKPAATENVVGFRPDSQAARMYTLLADGKPRTVQEIHKYLGDTTESHVRNGLLYALRKRGYQTDEFHIVNEDHRLRLVKGPKPTKEAKKKASEIGRKTRPAPTEEATSVEV